MNLNDSHPAWRRLVRAAQTCAAPEGGAAPFGFATRVAAQAARPAERGVIGGLERISTRALSLAGATAALVVLLTASPVVNALQDDIAERGSDPVAEVLDL